MTHQGRASIKAPSNRFNRISLLTALLLGALTTAQATPYGQTTEDVPGLEGIKLVARIDGFHNPNEGGATKASGSKFDFSVGALITGVPPRPLGQEIWAAETRIQKLEVKIGTQWIDIQQPEDNWTNWEQKRLIWKGIRFQPTYFAPNSNITIELRVTGLVRRRNYALSPPAGEYIEPPQGTVISSTVTATIYNDGLSFHTLLDPDYVNGGYMVSPLNKHNFAEVSRVGANEAKDILLSMNHSVRPGILHYKAQLIDHPTPTYMIPTVFFCFTHGELQPEVRILDSTLTVPPTTFLSPGPVQSAVEERISNPPHPSDVPDPHLVLHYACNTASAIWFPFAYRTMLTLYGQRQNRVFAGFTKEVWSVLWSNDPTRKAYSDTSYDSHLSDHSSALLLAISSKQRTLDAIDSANKLYPPRTLTKEGHNSNTQWWYDYHPMIAPYSPDPDAVLMNVYWTLSERLDTSLESGYETPAQGNPDWYFTRRGPAILITP